MSEPLVPPTTQTQAPPVRTAPAPAPDKAKPEKPRGLAGDAWRDLRKRPLFIISGILIVLFLAIAAFPGLFTSIDPNAQFDGKSLAPPESGHLFGYDLQRYDVFSRTIYGARVSIIVGTVSVGLTMLLGGLVGILAGYLGGWVDGLLSRLGDVFLGLPFVLGAIVILSTFSDPTNDPPWLGTLIRVFSVTEPVRITGLVIVTLVVLSWPTYARIMRSSVISAKAMDYVIAARSLGASPLRIVFRHVLPNSIGPMMVLATISIGLVIGAEATLSFLGVGLRSPVVSWGVMIADSRDYLQHAPHTVFFPSAALVLAVLSFVMMGDAVRDAFDPKQR